MRLPSRVICSECRKDVATHEARRRITAWARAGKGGTLSNLKGVVAEDLWLCDACWNMRVFGPSLFAGGEA